MGTKRSHSEATHSGKQQGHGSRPGPHKHFAKRRKLDANEDSFGAIKKRARAIERLLAKGDLKSAPKKVELERELAAHKERIEAHKAKKHRSYMIGKYHMVRFFERKKAMRLVKQLQKKLAEAEDPEEIAKIKADLHVAEVDVDYAIYHPFLETYISLYPSKDDKGDQPKALQHLHDPRPPMWSVVEKVREVGKTALEQLQNRRPEGGMSEKIAPKPETRPTSKAKDNSKHDRRAPQDTRQMEKGNSAQSAHASADTSDGDDDDFFDA